MKHFATALLALTLVPAGRAAAGPGPKVLQDVGFDQNLGAQAPPELEFADEVTITKALEGRREM